MPDFRTVTRVIWDARPDLQEHYYGVDWSYSSYFYAVPEWWCTANPPEYAEFSGDLIAYASTIPGSGLGSQAIRYDLCGILLAIWNDRPDIRQLWLSMPTAESWMTARAVAVWWVDWVYRGVLADDPGLYSFYGGDIYAYYESAYGGGGGVNPSASCVAAGGIWDEAAQVCRFPPGVLDPAAACAASGGIWDEAAQVCRYPAGVKLDLNWLEGKTFGIPNLLLVAGGALGAFVLISKR